MASVQAGPLEGTTLEQGMGRAESGSGERSFQAARTACAKVLRPGGPWLCVETDCRHAAVAGIGSAEAQRGMDQVGGGGGGEGVWAVECLLS